MQRIFSIRYRAILVVLLFGIPLLIQGAATSFAASAGHAPLNLRGYITVPGAPVSGWFRDVATTQDGYYYLSDASNNQVDKISIAQNKFVAAIGHGDFNGPGGSAGGDFSTQSPEGVAVIAGNIFVGNVSFDAQDNGHSQVRVYSQKTGALVQVIDTGGVKRSDEMTVMESLHLLAVTNPDEPGVPWLNFIETSTFPFQVVAKLKFPYAPTGPGVSGLQQPRWLGGNQLLIDVPSPTGNVNGGELDRITVNQGNGGYSFDVQRFPLSVNCQPAGLALDPAVGLAAVGCGYADSQGTGRQVIWDYVHNRVHCTFAAQGVDIVDVTGTGLDLFPAYLPNYNTMYVVNRDCTVVQTIATSDFAHTVTVDQESGEVFVPTGAPTGFSTGVVAVYSTED